ncbi:restriction endonuclease [Streptomyces sp. NPDC003038]|uniref:restriction endonuclease n=1 Tax=unclassified Streptomyces TaxID=2593676 RepID=UPI0033BE018F
MPRSGGRRRTAGRGSASVGRDVLLAAGLVGIGVGGLAVFVRTVAMAGNGAAVVPIAAVVLLAGGVALARWSVAPGHRRSRAGGRGTPVAVPAPRQAAVDVPDVGPEVLDHAGVDADGFEHTVAALCVRDGCPRVEVVGGAGDLGADVIATTPDGLRVVLQCKHYGDGNRVGSQDLQRFGGTCFAVHEADVAVVVTTSSFTAPAAEYAATCGIVCVDGDGLAAWTDLRAAPPWETPVATGADGHP